MEGDQYQTMVQNQTKFWGQMFEVESEAESEAESGIFLTGLRDTKCSRLAVTFGFHVISCLSTVFVGRCVYIESQSMHPGGASASMMWTAEA